MQSISASEVSEHLKLLENWNADGPDTLRNELLKIDSVDGVQMLVVLLNQQDMGVGGSTQ